MLRALVFLAAVVAGATSENITTTTNGTDSSFDELAARLGAEYAEQYTNSSPALKRVPEGYTPGYGYDYNFFVNGPSFAQFGGLSKFNYALSMDGKTVISMPWLKPTGENHWRMREGWPPYPDGSVRREWIWLPKYLLCLDAWWDGPTLRVHGWQCRKDNFNQMWLVEYDWTKLTKVVFIRPRHSPEYCLTVNGLTSSYNNPYAVVLDKCTWRVEQQQIWAAIAADPRPE